MGHRVVYGGTAFQDSRIVEKVVNATMGFTPLEGLMIVREARQVAAGLNLAARTE